MISDPLTGDPLGDLVRDLAADEQLVDDVVTAGALHVHPNTVRHRLRRLEELTGFGPDLSVLGTVRWWWAPHTWSPGS
jgi:hypothetical protein